MDVHDAETILPQLIRWARTRTRRSAPFAEKLSPIQKELRLRRQQFLGSYLPVRELVFSKSGVDDYTIEELSHYLASRSVLCWSFRDEDAEKFCHRFYRLAFYALSGGKVSGACIDDILHLVDCLVRSRKVFVVAMKDMLPQDMIGELFDFIDTADEIYFNAALADAILGGISVFLGVLKDPISIGEETKTEAD